MIKKAIVILVVFVFASCIFIGVSDNVSCADSPEVLNISVSTFPKSFFTPGAKNFKVINKGGFVELRLS